MNTYVLLKDLPDAKTGTEFKLGTIMLNREPYEMYIYGMYKNHQKAFDRETVENNPDWFKLKEEKVWTDSDMVAFGEYFDEPEAVKSSFVTFKNEHTKP